MAKLPALTARKVIRALKKVIMIHPELRIRTVVPVHAGRSIKEPLLRAIIREANLTIDEFLDLV